MSKLFEPYTLAGLRLPNRIVMAPMTRSRVGDGNQLGELNAEYYAQRATAGLIVSEAIVVDPMGRGYLFTPGLHDAVQIDGARKVTAAVHEAGGRILAQLWHVGRVSHSAVLPGNAAPVGPTAAAEPELYTFSVENGVAGKYPATQPRALTDREIAEIPLQFAAAAENALEAGFDGFEILAGNGYLFEQFQNTGVNTRKGRYGGGAAESRCRLLLETIDAVQNRVGRDRLLGVRLSPFGTFNCMPKCEKTTETYLYAAHQLEHRGVQFVHLNDEPVSVGHLNAGAESQEAKATTQRLIPPAFRERFREVYKGTVIICGALDRWMAEEMLSNGEADLCAFGISYIANPDLVHRMKESIPLAHADTDLFYGGGARGYTDYPRAG